jgi:dihydroxy-acid dehydratase
MVPRLIEAVQRGVMQAGAHPIVFPTIAPHEAFAHPTGMPVSPRAINLAMGH